MNCSGFMNEIKNTLTLHQRMQPALSTMVHSEDGGETIEYSLKNLLTWLLQCTNTNTVNVMLKWITHTRTVIKTPITETDTFTEKVLEREI